MLVHKTTKTPFTDCSITGVHYLDIDTDIHIMPFGKFEMVNHRLSFDILKSEIFGQAHINQLKAEIIGFLREISLIP